MSQKFNRFEGNLKNCERPVDSFNFKVLRKRKKLYLNGHEEEFNALELHEIDIPFT